MIRTTSLTLILFISACASSSGIKEFLDPETGVTVSFSDTPLVLYQDRSGRAAFARDLVNLGPIQINRMGRNRYYLWLGIWSTIKTRYDDSRADGYSLVTVYADGEPMLLNLAGWNSTAIGVSRPIYSRPVSGAHEAYYEVSIDQIRILAQAQDIRVLTSGDRSASYEMWDSSETATRGFREFLTSVTF